MKKYFEIEGAVCTKSCKVVVGKKSYTIIGQYTYHCGDNAKAVYYVIGETTPELAIQCGNSSAGVHYLDNYFIDYWFWIDVQKYGIEMTDKYDSEILKYRKVG